MTEQPIPLDPSDITPGDPVATLWKWSIRNGWRFAPDFAGGEPWLDPRLVWQLIAPHTKWTSCNAHMLNRVPRHNGMVRLSDVLNAGRAANDQ